MDNEPPADPTTIYGRLGGEKGIERLLVTFYGLVLADPVLKPFFAHVPMNKLVAMQRELFGAVLGGPHTYTGRDLAAVHAGLKIDDRQFHLFRQHLLETLQQAGASAEYIREVVRRVTAMKKQVIPPV